MTTAIAETSSAEQRLLRAGEYAELPDRGVPTEPVQGRVVARPV